MKTSLPDPLALYDWHVLVLHDGQEKDILGIWGPYVSETAAELAREELKKWPLDGVWTVMEVKHFPTPQAKSVGSPAVSWEWMPRSTGQ